MKTKILIVDDDRNMLSACERILRCKFDLETAAGGVAALEKIKTSGPYGVVMADRQMPVMDGLQFLNKVREVSPDSVRLMLTGNADMDAVIRLVNESNIFRFLTKPCPTNLLIKALEDAQKLYQLVVAERELLDKTLNGSTKLLTDILAMAESPASAPPQELGDALADAIARLGLENAWQIHLAVMLAPIGNVTVPPETLVRARSHQALSPAEEQMLAHLPETAARLLVNIPRLEGVAQIVRYQNKCFDGSGIPIDDLAGDAIPVGARLLKIIFDYTDLHRGGVSGAAAFDAMRGRAGLYDPALLSALQQSLEGKANGQIKALKLNSKVTARELVIGMTLRTNVETKDGTLILRAGHQITEMTLEKILNFERVFGIKEPILIETVEAPA